MNLSRFIFGITLLVFPGMLLFSSLPDQVGQRILMAGMLVLWISVWGSMAYLVKTKYSKYRKYWATCAAISAAWFYMIFGPTVLNLEIEPISHESVQTTEMHERSSKMEYLYQRPWRISRLYTLVYSEIKNTEHRDDPLFFGPLILVLILPVDLLISLYHCWRPISKKC